MKEVRWLGRSKEDLLAFPIGARREAGYQLSKVRHGEEPSDWKPMNTIGAGVREIRLHDESGAFRVIYVAKFADTIYVLHAFQKKTQKTSARDLQLATTRFHAVTR